MIAYAVLTLFFAGAAINGAVTAAHYASFNYYDDWYPYTHHGYYRSLFPAAIVTMVRIILVLEIIFYSKAKHLYQNKRPYTMH